MTDRKKVLHMLPNIQWQAARISGWSAYRRPPLVSQPGESEQRNFARLRPPLLRNHSRHESVISEFRDLGEANTSRIVAYSADTSRGAVLKTSPQSAGNFSEYSINKNVQWRATKPDAATTLIEYRRRVPGSIHESARRSSIYSVANGGGDKMASDSTLTGAPMVRPTGKKMVMPDSPHQTTRPYYVGPPQIRPVDPDNDQSHSDASRTLGNGWQHDNLESAGEQTYSDGIRHDSSQVDAPMSEIHLDGQVLGQWIQSYLGRALTRPQTGANFIDGRGILTWPGQALFI